jgi:hypothetical protein
MSYKQGTERAIWKMRQKEVVGRKRYREISCFLYHVRDSHFWAEYIKQNGPGGTSI